MKRQKHISRSAHYHTYARLIDKSLSGVPNKHSVPEFSSSEKAYQPSTFKRTLPRHNETLPFKLIHHALSPYLPFPPLHAPRSHHTSPPTPHLLLLLPSPSFHHISTKEPHPLLSSPYPHQKNSTSSPHLPTKSYKILPPSNKHTHTQEAPPMHNRHSEV